MPGLNGSSESAGVGEASTTPAPKPERDTPAEEPETRDRPVGGAGDEGRSRRAEVIATIAVIAVVVAVPGGAWLRRRFAERPTIEECRQLVERYVSFVAQARDPDAAPAEMAKRRAPGPAPSALERCRASLTRAEARCALSATNADEMERCAW